MNVVLIGLGMVARTHLAAIKGTKGLKLAGVMGRNHANASLFAEEASRALGYEVHAIEDLKQLDGNVPTNFAIVATPPNARRELVQGLVDFQIPILMEKPVERSFEAAKEIVAMCEDANVPTGVFFQNRTKTAANDLYCAAQAGDLGDILMADIRVPWWRDQSYYDEPGRGTYARDGGGVLINQAIHTLDLALWILGPWKDVQAKQYLTKLHRMEAEDWAAAVFETLNGAVGTFCATTASYPGTSESVFLQGTKAKALLQDGILTITHRDGSTTVTGTQSTSGGGVDPMAFTHGWHQNILEDFVKCLQCGTIPLVTAREALKSHAVIDAMEKSHRLGHRVEVEQV